MKSLNDLPKDVVQHLSKYIEETPEEWEKFKQTFKNSNQATMAKKNEVLNRPVWVFFYLYGSGIRGISFHLTRPTIGEGIWVLGEPIVIQKTMKDLINIFNLKKQ